MLRRKLKRKTKDTATGSMFFDDYPEFLSTSGTSAQSGRFNLRHEAIFTANQDVFRGARVLDLASHDGRWSFAALRSGASHVVGVEARKELVDNADATLRHYGADPDSYRFVCGDVFDVMANEPFEVDVVLCLGYLYHTYRHPELLHGIRALAPRHFIVDTRVIPKKQAFVHLRFDRVEKEWKAYQDPFSPEGRTVVGWPSAPALEMLLEAYDFEIEDKFDWKGLVAAHPGTEGVSDYASGRRVTWRCRRQARE